MKDFTPPQIILFQNKEYFREKVEHNSSDFSRKIAVKLCIFALDKENDMKKRVVIGLSGGVDSSVAAYVLQQQGYDVVALFMRNWTDTTGLLKADCPWLDDKFDAEAVARKLGIPFHFVDLSEHYRKRVVDYMFDEYAKGRTPNPDVLCNREIKFDVFMERALELGADFVATGHYCRKQTIEVDGQPVHRLLAGSDGNKDQSYFLGELYLGTAHKKDSQGTVLVGKVDLPVVLQQKLAAKEGKVFLLEPDCEIFSRPNITPESSEEELYEDSRNYAFHPRFGRKIGTHQGAHFYTIGQRKGLNIGGFPLPLFVVGTNVDYNQIFVGMGDDHPGLHRRTLRISPSEMHWVRPDLKLKEGQRLRVEARIRYRQPLQKATAVMGSKALYVVFDEAQRGVTAGQFAALYIDDEVVASGVIAE